MIGGISVSVTTGLGSAIVTTASGDNQVSVCFFPVFIFTYEYLRSLNTGSSIS